METWVYVCVFQNRVVREGPAEKVTFKSRPEGGEEVKHKDIWMIQWCTKEWKRFSA